MAPPSSHKNEYWNERFCTTQQIEGATRKLRAQINSRFKDPSFLKQEIRAYLLTDFNCFTKQEPLLQCSITAWQYLHQADTHPTG